MNDHPTHPDSRAVPAGQRHAGLPAGDGTLTPWQPGEPSTEPVTPDQLEPGDRIWHPFEGKLVTVTHVYPDSLAWRRGENVPATEVWWREGERASIIKHVAGDAPLHRSLSGPVVAAGEEEAR